MYANGLGQSVLPYGGVHTVLGALPALIHPNPHVGCGHRPRIGRHAYSPLGGRAETPTYRQHRDHRARLDTLRRLDQRRSILACGCCSATIGCATGSRTAGPLLQKGRRRYDIIEADALRPTSAYAGNLYSVEYFELLRDHLNPQGLAVTWAPTAACATALLTAFPHVLLFDDIAIGSMTPVPFDALLHQCHPFTRNTYSPSISESLPLPHISQLFATSIQRSSRQPRRVSTTSSQSNTPSAARRRRSWLP